MNAARHERQTTETQVLTLRLRLQPQQFRLLRLVAQASGLAFEAYLARVLALFADGQYVIMHRGSATARPRPSAKARLSFQP